MGNPLFSFPLFFQHIFQTGVIEIRKTLFSACDDIQPPLRLVRMHDDCAFFIFYNDIAICSDMNV